MNKISQSGLFGYSEPADETIDNIEEVAGAIDDIGSGDFSDPDAMHQPGDLSDAVPYVSLIALATAHRVRLLTWVVAAVVLYLVLKEVN